MRALVCGGRDFGRYNLLCNEMDAAREAFGIDTIITGGAHGADRLAARWAKDYGVDQVIFPANWVKHGKAAGPIRNQKMIDEGKPDLVMAFPGGRGTDDMVRRAERSGIRVLRFTEPVTNSQKPVK